MASEPVEERGAPTTEEPTDQLSTALGSFDLLADEAAGSGLVAALVWVFALDWINGYETDVFNDVWQNATADPQTYQRKVHGCFAIFIAITVGAGGFGVMALTFYYNVMKLVNFQVQKTGVVTRAKTEAAAQMIVSLDLITYIGRFFGVVLAFPAFMVSAMVYFWAKVKHNTGLGEDASEDQAIAVTVIIAVPLAAAGVAFIWMMLKYKKFKETVTGQADAFGAADWHKTAFR
eukprot:Hpha_TRINITY_DN16204_c1_g1::TRINITY_DN16204_c1_g1_i1::g.15180::m.15180